ncbi:IclR family transcriptional regulator [Halogeometricum borinquense DSM 11551]|uniref:IclR family transcriptional regulator n=2 Tax=Halogeometricum borinquense TaxID=60847 RepID=E4NQE3_HALBP|nr:winged helix-turn-helix domain-containing protein [Halogeometricum borinquense]ADQ67816.1 IclR-like transcriptional regulator [Halogeometricum borinquense DSM 11551]ELY23502.1 IclR family transcriptional regulator [Halogeometricum borinquense DSM 11551]RYJ13239.1 ArsR family transcriptional regulator [Halogeometricum borinquense]
MGDERERETLLDVLGDEDARSILASVGERSCSAKELADEHGLSLPTVYRRLDRLAEHGLVASNDTVEEDGTHYKRYEATFERAVVTLHGSAYRIRIDHGDEITTDTPSHDDGEE